MADVANEVMYGALNAIQARLEQADGKADENKQDMQALRTQMLGIHRDLPSIEELGGVQTALVRHEARLDRIERRLGSIDAPAQ